MFKGKHSLLLASEGLLVEIGMPIKICDYVSFFDV